MRPSVSSSVGGMPASSQRIKGCPKGPILNTLPSRLEQIKWVRQGTAALLASSHNGVPIGCDNRSSSGMMDKNISKHMSLSTALTVPRAGREAQVTKRHQT